MSFIQQDRSVSAHVLSLDVSVLILSSGGARMRNDASISVTSRPGAGSQRAPFIASN